MTTAAEQTGFRRTMRLIFTDSHFLLPLAVLALGLALLCSLR